MSEKSKSLMDMMLEESARKDAEEAVQGHHHAPAPRQEEEVEEETAWPDDVEQLLALSGKDLRRWMAEVAPGDLLCVVAEGSQALKARVMGSLDEESVQWIEGNLKIWDPATDALKASSRKAVLEVARELIAEGKIALPESLQAEGQQQDTDGETARDELTEALLELVAVAHAKGREALASIVDDSDHPLLGFGLRCVLELDDPEAVESALAERQRALEVAYRAELEIIRQALISIARGDSPQTFVKRVAP